MRGVKQLVLSTLVIAGAAIATGTTLGAAEAFKVDDQIRWTAFQRIYTDEFADRYVAGGTRQVQYDLVTMLRFPDMEPFGTYPVHIIVKHRRMALIGVVITDVDKTQILFRARQVPHAVGVDDAIAVRR
jgi:hypothetical protein